MVLRAISVLWDREAFPVSQDLPDAQVLWDRRGLPDHREIRVLQVLWVNRGRKAVRV